MKKIFVLLVALLTVVPSVVMGAQNYLFTRFDNKYATPILSELQDYRVGIHMEQDSRIPSLPLTYFVELGGLHELEWSRDISVGIIVGLGPVTGIAAYNNNTIPTLGNCTTFMLQYKLGGK